MTDEANALRSIRMLLDPQGGGVGWTSENVVDRVRDLIAENRWMSSERSDLRFALDAADCAQVFRRRSDGTTSPTTLADVAWDLRREASRLQERVDDLERRLANAEANEADADAEVARLRAELGRPVTGALSPAGPWRGERERWIPLRVANAEVERLLTLAPFLSDEVEEAESRFSEVGRLFVTDKADEQ